MKAFQYQCSLCEAEEHVDAHDYRQAWALMRRKGWARRPSTGLYMCQECSDRMESAAEDMSPDFD